MATDLTVDTSAGPLSGRIAEAGFFDAAWQ